jgi:hypothetical protein
MNLFDRTIPAHSGRSKPIARENSRYRKGKLGVAGNIPPVCAFYPHDD